MTGWTLIVSYYVGISGHHIDKVFEYVVPVVSEVQCRKAAAEIMGSLQKAVVLPASSEINVRCSKP